jgi:hypothetical protein
MSTPRERIRISTLKEGGYYLQRSGFFVRKIDRIIGKDVFWHDYVGTGKCTKATFAKNCIYEATPEEVEERLTKKEAQLSDEEMKLMFPGGFALRDEANGIVAFAFRNTQLETLHAGKDSHLLEDDSYSRITEAEMKSLMIEACEKMERLLRMKEQHPEHYRKFIMVNAWAYCRSWNRK